MNTIYLSDKQLAWLGKVFLETDANTKIKIDAKYKLEQQLDELGAFDEIDEIDEIDEN